MQTYPSERRRVWVADAGDLNPVIPNQFQQLTTVRKNRTHTTLPVPARGGDQQQTMMRRPTDAKPPNDSQSWDVTNRNSPKHGTYEFTDGDG